MTIHTSQLFHQYHSTWYKLTTGRNSGKNVLCGWVFYLQVSYLSGVSYATIMVMVLADFLTTNVKLDLAEWGMVTHLSCGMMTHVVWWLMLSNDSHDWFPSCTYTRLDKPLRHCSSVLLLQWALNSLSAQTSALSPAFPSLYLRYVFIPTCCIPSDGSSGRVANWPDMAPKNKRQKSENVSSSPI